MAFLICLFAFGLIAWLVSQPGIPPIDTATTGFLHGLASPDPRRAHGRRDLCRLEPRARSGRGACRCPALSSDRRRAEAIFIVIALVGTLVLNDALKLLFQRPRPGFDWAEVWPETSFPSGHSMNSFVVYLAIALVIWRLEGRRVGIVALVLAIVLVVSVGISRIYLGAHWLSDVIGGYLAGALWLLFLVAAWALVSWLRRGVGAPTPGRGWGGAARASPTRR